MAEKRQEGNNRCNRNTGPEYGTLRAGNGLASRCITSDVYVSICDCGERLKRKENSPQREEQSRWNVNQGKGKEVHHVIQSCDVHYVTVLKLEMISLGIYYPLTTNLTQK